MSQDKKISLHYLEARYWRSAEIEVSLRQNGEVQEAWRSQTYDVLIDGEKVDTLWRDPSNVTHQVHGRIRHDNRPQVRFKADKSGTSYRDTRVLALGDILMERGVASDANAVHLPGRKPWWVSCGLCGGGRS